MPLAMLYQPIVQYVIDTVLPYLECEATWSEIGAGQFLKEVLEDFSCLVGRGLRPDQKTVQLTHQLLLPLVNLHTHTCM